MLILQTQASKVEAEVKTWAEQYRKAVEAHGRALCTAAARARERHQQRVEEQNRLLEDRTQHALDAVKFAQEVSASDNKGLGSTAISGGTK